MSKTINISWNFVLTDKESVEKLVQGLDDLLTEIVGPKKILGETRVLNERTRIYEVAATVTAYEAEHAIVVLYDSSKSGTESIDLLFFPGNMYHEVRDYLQKLPEEIGIRITGLHMYGDGDCFYWNEPVNLPNPETILQ